MSARSVGSVSADRADVEAMMRRVIQLPHRGQLELYSMLAERLADAKAVPMAQQDAIVRQQSALSAMQQVASALKLPEGQAPTTTQFDAQAKVLELPWNVSSVGRAFSSRAGWGLATRAFEGGRLPETTRQVRQRRYLANRKQDRVEHLAAVREWLDADPPDESTESYARWRAVHNMELQENASAPLAVARRYFRQVFPEMSWEDVMAAARGKVASVTELSRQRAEERLRTEPNPLRLVGTTTAAALLGLTTHVVQWQVTHKPKTFPTVVAVKARNQRGFLEADIRAHAAGEPFPQRVVGHLSRRILSSTELAGVLGCKPNAIQRACETSAWHNAPEPDGHFSNMNYWLRANVTAWLKRHPGA